MRYWTFALLIALCTYSTLRAAPLEIEATILKARVAHEKADAEDAIAELRNAGPAALARLFVVRDQIAGSNDKSSLEKLDAIIDRVGGAKYCTASRLYWYTDLAAAQAAAKESRKPILSLRMMGNLTDEFSCANSRFFRTSLYANEEISNYLRDHYVLHWKSVRPVPKVTIDFGDGRTLERTLTGNSIHYVLTSDGQPVDGLPGLYAPARFKKWLQDVEAVAKYCEQGAPQRAEAMAFFHGQQIDQIARAWQTDLAAIGNAVAPSSNGPPVPGQPGPQSIEQIKAKLAEPAVEAPRAIPKAPRADKAAEIARPKSLVEMPLIRAVASIETLEKNTDDAVWEKIAALHNEEARLDQSSVRLIRSQNPTAAEAGRRAETKRRVEDPIVKMVAAFQSSIALDTVRNEYLLHRKLHQWFLDRTADPNVEKLNDRVYAELFLTPKTDPWIGLVPENTYTALENGGVVKGGGK